MIAFICLFFPAVLAVSLHEHLSQTDFPLKKWICLYAVNNMLINFACFLVKRVILGTAAQSFYHEMGDILPVTGLNFLMMAIPTAILLGIAESYLFRHTHLTLEEPDDDQED